MAYANDIHTSAPIAAGNFALLKNLRERIARYRVYRETVLELSTLSERELADLGLSRGTVRAVAYEAAYGH